MMEDKETVLLQFVKVKRINMETIEGKGHHWKEKRKKRIKIIKLYILKNPGKTKKEYSEELGMEYRTFLNDLKIIKSEE